jgi:carbamoyl-phosphate synthase small subunit
MKNKAILLLKDGTVFHGKSIGKQGTSTGELCFNTGMTGYQEVFTDPSYFGQILVETTPHIGNYGAHTNENESDSVKIAGLVCSSYSDTFSRKLANGSINDKLISNSISGISGIDTRMLVRHIREKGAMNAIISSEEFDVAKLTEQLNGVPSMEGLELASKVTCAKPYEVGNPNNPIRIALLDLGCKQNIINCLVAEGVFVKVFPKDVTYADMQAFNPDGYMISNGPGDPGAMPNVVETVKEIIADGNVTFGICLGHQVISLASGLATFKMHNGHRGVNHPVQNLATGKCEVTSQNHGFGVNADDIDKLPNVEVTHINLNDNTVEGIKRTDKPVFSVQYHPEASAGPHDSQYLFNDFINKIKEHKN